jgi:hypothetical protein
MCHCCAAGPISSNLGESTNVTRSPKIGNNLIFEIAIFINHNFGDDHGEVCVGHHCRGAFRSDLKCGQRLHLHRVASCRQVVHHHLDPRNIFNDRYSAIYVDRISLLCTNYWCTYCRYVRRNLATLQARETTC